MGFEITGRSARGSRRRRTQMPHPKLQPPAYRPASRQGNDPAPPVFRPQATAQAKPRDSAGWVPAQGAPPVYRPSFAAPAMKAPPVYRPAMASTPQMKAMAPHVLGWPGPQAPIRVFTIQLSAAAGTAPTATATPTSGSLSSSSSGSTSSGSAAAAGAGAGV